MTKTQLDQLSHGFNSKFFNPSLCNQVYAEALDYLNSCNWPTYFGDVFDTLPSARSFLNSDTLAFVSKLLNCEEPTFCASEFHCQIPGSIPIPLHQDNFYHCILEGLGVKLLIPLSKLTPISGSLYFYDVPSCYPLLKHNASNINNFSCFIPDKKSLSSMHSTTSYHYSPGDISYHFLNSPHFSRGNHYLKATLFIVLRFHHQNAEISTNMLETYNNTYLQHRKNLLK